MHKFLFLQIFLQDLLIRIEKINKRESFKAFMMAKKSINITLSVKSTHMSYDSIKKKYHCEKKTCSLKILLKYYCELLEIHL